MAPRPSRRRAALSVAALLALVGCSNDVPVAAPRTTPPAAAGTPVACPNPHGGVCRGPLGPGTYTTGSFTPTLTYTVPTGWDNEEDLPGNFLLLPPGGSLSGVDAGSSDYIGVYSSVRVADPDCAPTQLTDVAATPADMAAYFTAHAGLATTNRRDVTVDGRPGVAVDISLKKGWTTGCDALSGPLVPMIIGVGLSELEHAVIPGLTVRLLLVEDHGSVLAIEIDDASGGAHLDTYEALVETFDFAD